MAAGAAPPSRYQVVRLISPRPGVAIAQVRRDDLAGKDKRFSEMAMYVLIELHYRQARAASGRLQRKRLNTGCGLS
jgi:hypothetical protein